MTLRLIKFFDDQKIMSIELLYVGIWAAIKRRVCNILYELILISDAKNYRLDRDVMNATIALLVQNERVDEAWHLMEMNLNGKFGQRFQIAFTTYSQFILTAQMMDERGVVSNLLESMPIYYPNLLQSLNPHLHRNQQTLYLSMLHNCAYSGDFNLALEAYELYIQAVNASSKAVGSIDPRAHCLLLLTYLRIPDSKSSTSYAALDSIIQSIVSSEADKLPAIANLLLQVFCHRDDARKAESYLQRMKTTRIDVSTNALLAYDDMIRRLGVNSSLSSSSPILFES
jgi:hypothetical protein